MSSEKSEREEHAAEPESCQRRYDLHLWAYSSNPVFVSQSRKNVSHTVGEQRLAIQRGMTEAGRTVPRYCPADRGSSLRLFCHLQRIVDLDTEISHCTFQFRVTK